MSPGIGRREFGELADGRPVHEYTLDNGAGMSFSAINGPIRSGAPFADFAPGVTDPAV